MPSRKRHRRAPEDPDPVVRFGRAIKEADERERAERKRIRAERAEAKRQERLAAEYAAAVEQADRRLQQAIAAVKRAHGERNGIDEAEHEYRSAKADVIELETGERPDWAPVEPSDTA